jgi:hypothetical protein
LSGESDVHKQDGDRVSTVNMDCRNSKPESTPSMEDNKREKKRELATAQPDASLHFKEMSAGVRHCLHMNPLPYNLNLFVALFIYINVKVFFYIYDFIFDYNFKI